MFTASTEPRVRLRASDGPACAEIGFRSHYKVVQVAVKAEGFIDKIHTNTKFHESLFCHRPQFLPEINLRRCLNESSSG